jgi:hypothetical protein
MQEFCANELRARDCETAEDMRERAQKYVENHGTGINSIAELNEALGFTLPLNPLTDNKVCRSAMVSELS